MGKKKSSAAPAPVPMTTINYSPAELQRREALAQDATSLYLSQRDSLEANKGNHIAKPVGPSAETQQAFDRTGTDVKNLDAAAKTANDSLAWFLSGKVLDANTNPGLKSHMDGVATQMRQDATEGGGVFNQLRNSSVADGSFGSSRQAIAEAMAVGKVNQNIGTVMSGMANENYQKGLSAMTTALGLAPQTQKMYNEGSIRLAQTGQAKEGYTAAQNNYDAKVAEWNMNKQQINLNNLASVIYGAGSSMTSTMPTSQLGAGGVAALPKPGEAGSSAPISASNSAFSQAGNNAGNGQGAAVGAGESSAGEGGNGVTQGGQQSNTPGGSKTSSQPSAFNGKGAFDGGLKGAGLGFTVGGPVGAVIGGLLGAMFGSQTGAPSTSTSTNQNTSSSENQSSGESGGDNGGGGGGGTSAAANAGGGSNHGQGGSYGGGGI